MSPRCPGQDQRYWTPDDIYDVSCSYCGRTIEFWKDEPSHACRDCGREVRNPRIDLSCAEWCASADECLGRGANDGNAAAPVAERMMAHLERRLNGHPERLELAREMSARIDTLLRDEPAEPRLAKPAALLAGVALRGSRLVGEKRVPEVDQELLDSGAMREVLKGAGIGDEDAKAVEELVRSVFSPSQPVSAEWRLVRHAVQLVLQRSSSIAGSSKERIS